MGMEWFNEMDGDGETPMSRAMKCGHNALASFMSRQEEDDRPENAAGDTLVQRAAYWGLEQAMTKSVVTKVMTQFSAVMVMIFFYQAQVMIKSLAVTEMTL